LHRRCLSGSSFRFRRRPECRVRIPWGRHWQYRPIFLGVWSRDRGPRDSAPNPRPTNKCQPRLPVEFGEARLIIGFNQPEGMCAKVFHETKMARESVIGHCPENRSLRFPHEPHEIPTCIVCALTLRNFVMLLWCNGMNKIGKIECILVKKDRYVVVYWGPVTLHGIRLGREPIHIARDVVRVTPTRWKTARILVLRAWEQRTGCL